MKAAKVLSLVVILAVSGQALADVPPPLKPIEILEPESGKPAPATKPTTPEAKPAPVVQPAPQKPAPVVTQPPVVKPEPVKPAPQKPAPVVTQPPVTKPAPVTPPVVKPAPTTPVAKPQPVVKPAPPIYKPAPPVYNPPTVAPAPPVYKPAPPVYQPPQTVSSLGGFDVGQKVVTDTHYKGVIRSISRDRTAQVQFAYGTETWPLSRLSREINELQGFIKGQTVITDSHYKGVITDIFTDRTAQVKFAYGTENWPLSRLAPEIDELGGFEVGQNVITDSHYRGRIVQIFADRTAQVQFAFGTENWPLSRLGREVRSLGGFEVGQQVVTDTHYRGRIIAVYADRTAQVQFSYGTETWPLSRLGVAVTTLMGFTVGDIAVTDTHHRGQIREIFADRTATVAFSYGVENWPLSRLGKAITSLKGFNVGQSVHTDTGYRGQILEIYGDSTALVGFAHGQENWPLSRLSMFYCPSNRCPR